MTVKYETYEIGELGSMISGFANSSVAPDMRLGNALNKEELTKLAQMLEDYQALLYSSGKVKIRVVKDPK